MNPQIQIRPMTADDLPASRRLWAGAKGVELAEGDSLEELTGYLQRNPDTSQVAVRGDRLVAAVLAGHDGRRGFLYHLAVSPEEQGSGLGKALVSRSLAALRAAGVVRVLILVAGDNERGRAFWKSQGWEPLATAQPMGINL